MVRDAQITEKQEIHRQLREEELQLERKMLEECDRAIKEEKIHREQLKKLNEKHAEDLRIQLQRREMRKYLEAQRIEEEAKAIVKAQQAINEDSRKKEMEKREKIQRVRRDMQQANQLSDFFKGLVFEEERIAEMKAQEHMRKRRERDAELEKERRLLREQKQREADRMLVLQTKFQQTIQQQEEMKLRLIREEKDRQYRQREKEAALKKKQMDQKLLTAREAQLVEMQRVRAIQIAQEEEEHKRALAKLEQAVEKERRENERLHQMKERYRKGSYICICNKNSTQKKRILKRGWKLIKNPIISFLEIINQIDEKVIKKKEQKALATAQEAIDKQKEEIRRKNIEKLLVAKVNSMRHSNIPEKFVKDVERQIKFTENAKFVK